MKLVLLYLTEQLKLLRLPSIVMVHQSDALADNTSRHCLHLSGGRSHVHCTSAYGGPVVFAANRWGEATASSVSSCNLLFIFVLYVDADEGAAPPDA